MTTWSEAFASYLVSVGLTQQEALFSLRRLKIHVTPSQVSYWCRGSRPRDKMRERIERWSKGAVAAQLPSVPTASPRVSNELDHRKAG